MFKQNVTANEFITNNHRAALDRDSVVGVIQRRLLVIRPIANTLRLMLRRNRNENNFTSEDSPLFEMIEMNDLVDMEER